MKDQTFAHANRYFWSLVCVAAATIFCIPAFAWHWEWKWNLLDAVFISFMWNIREAERGHA